MMTEKEWLEARKSGIGGSDAATILGLNPYKTNKYGKRKQEEKRLRIYLINLM